MPSSSLNRPMSRLSLPSLFARDMRGMSKVRIGRGDVRLEAPEILVLAADGIAGGDGNPGLAVIAAVHVHPEDVLLGPVIVDDLGALDDAVWAEVARRGAGEQGADVGPLDQVGGGVAVDVAERVAAALVLADHVVGSVDLDEACAVGL